MILIIYYKAFTYSNSLNDLWNYEHLQFDFQNIHFNVINIKTIKQRNFNVQTDVKCYEMRSADGP